MARRRRSRMRNKKPGPRYPGTVGVISVDILFSKILVTRVNRKMRRQKRGPRADPAAA
jgi:hypothetical protein